MLPFAVFLALAQQGLTPPPKPASDAVLATVDGAPVTAGELEPYLWAWKTREALNELLTHKMIQVEATRLGVSVTDAELQAKVDSETAALKGSVPPGGTLEAAIQAKFGSLSRLSLAARSFLLIDKIAEKEFQPANYVKVSAMLFPTTGETTDTLKAAIKASDMAYAGLVAGKTWEAILANAQKNPVAPARGTGTGWAPLDVLREGVRSQIPNLKPLGVAKPVQTPNGIQLFRLLARGTDAKDAELADLKTQYMTNARQTVVQRIRDKVKIEIK